VCERCNARFAVDVTIDCSNCPRYHRGPPSVFLISKTEVASFLTDHGINPTDPSWERAPPAVVNYDEEIVGINPFEAHFTFTIEGDELRLTVDGDLSVVDVARRERGQESDI
jgi:hypothetical protein